MEITSNQDIDLVLQICRLHCGNIEINDSKTSPFPSFYQRSMESEQATSYECKTTGRRSAIGNLVLFSNQTMFLERIGEFKAYFNDKKEYGSGLAFILKPHEVSLQKAYYRCLKKSNSSLFVPSTVEQIESASKFARR